MGRSSFSSLLFVHANAIEFMGWVTIFVAQSVLATTGNIALHRRLGWIAALWIVPILVLGFTVTIAMARRGQVPFFFRPQHFLIFDPMSLIGFATLMVAGITLRRQTDWHRRLNFCGMALLLGPGFGRLLPPPLLAPWAFEATFVMLMLFPLAGIVADLRRDGTVHRAWGWGIAAMAATLLLTEAIGYGALGSAIYRGVTAGSPGAAVAPLAFARPPVGGRTTGRSS